MEGRNPIAAVFPGLFKLAKFVILTIGWVIIVLGVLVKNR